MAIVLGQMLPEELRRVRTAAIMLEAVHLGPMHFSREEIIAAVREDMEAGQAVRRRLEVGPGQGAVFDLTTGAVLEDNEA